MPAVASHNVNKAAEQTQFTTLFWEEYDEMQWTPRRRTVLFAALLTVFLLGGVAAAQTAQSSVEAEAEAGVTPDSALYGVELALDRVRLALTFTSERKADLALRIAEERLAEARVMAQQNNTQGLKRAQEQYAAAATQARASIRKADASAEFNANAKRRLTQQQAAFQNMEAAIASRAAADAQVQQEAASIDQSMEQVQTAVADHQNRTVTALRQQGRSNEEIRTEFAAAANRTGLTGFHREKASERLDQADTCRSNAAELEVATQRQPQFTHMINVSTQHYDAAQAAFNANRYGEAFGRATASWRICRAATAWANGASEEEVRERFEDAQEDMRGDFHVSIEVSCSGGLNETIQTDVDVEIEENGVEEEVAFTVTGTSCPPSRDRIVSEIADRTSLSEEEARSYMGPGMEAGVETAFDVEDARQRFRERRESLRDRMEEQREAFEEQYRNRTAGFEHGFSCENDAENQVSVSTGDEAGEINVSARTALNHGGYTASADVQRDTANQELTVTVQWNESGPGIQCLGEGRGNQNISVSQSGEWTVTVRIVVDGDEVYSRTTTVSVQNTA